MKIKDIVSIIFFSLFLNAPLALAQNAAILPQGRTQFLDNNANPLSSGKVYFYIPSTTTFKTTWQDAGKTIPNTNPVVLDAGGRGIIYGDGTYRQRVFDRNNNLIFDAVTASAGTGGSTTSTGDGDLVGTVKPWAGLVAPNQYVFAYGQEISRTTYAAFYTAVTLNQNISCTSASPTLTGLSDTSQIPVGAVLEATCIAAGSTVVSKTSTTVTMNNNASLTTATTGVFFLYGNGNGSTTFNVPDLRGNTIAGRCNMGGTDCSNLTLAGLGENPSATGAQGGNSTRTLLPGNLPAYTPSGTISTTTNTTINDGRVWTVDGQPLGGAANPSVFQQAGAGLAIGGPKSISIAGSISATSNSSSTFTGTAQGGTSTAFSIVQPTLTLNYIIKIVPDQNSASASGVTSLGLMTGDIACGTGLLCTGNVISTTGALWAQSGNDIYNTNSGSVLVGTTTPTTAKFTLSDDVSAANLLLDIHSKNASYSMAAGAPSQFAQIYSGSAANPITTATPTVSISRREALTVDSSGGQNAALWVENLGNDTAGVGGFPNPQPVAVVGFSTQLGSGDSVGVYANSQQNGSVVPGTSYAAFGAVGQASALVSGTSAIGVAAATENRTGSNQLYAGNGVLGRGHPNTIGVDVAAFGTNRQTVGVYVHTNSTVGWDVGLAFDTVGGHTGTVTADIQDNTSAATILLDQGTHTNGIDLRSGTYSGSPFISTGFNVDAVGNISAKAIIHTSSILLGSTSGQLTLNANAISGTNTITFPAATGIVALTNGANIPAVAQGDILYGSATSTLSALAKSTTATRYLSNTGSSNNPAWAQIDLTNGVTGRLPFANEQQGTANSVRANCTSSTADITNVQAGAADQVFRVGTGSNPCAWGAINLASTNAVGGILGTANGGTGLSSLGTGIATFLGTPSSANLAAAVTDETGSGALVFANTPTLAAPQWTGAAAGVTLNLTGVFTFTAQANIGTGPGFSYSTGNTFLLAGGSSGFTFNNNAGTTNIMLLSNTGALSSLLSMTAGTYLKNAVTTVAGLPTCNAGLEGGRYGVTDATIASAVFGTILVGGSTVHTSAYCNGTNWIGG